MPFAAIQIQLEIIISEVSQKRKAKYDTTYMWNLRYDTNGLIHETEMDSQIQRIDLWLPRGREVIKGWIGSLGLADANYYI